MLILATGSLFILYSASGKNFDLLTKQATSFGIGLVGMLIIAQFEPRFMARWVPLAYIGGVGLLVAVDVMGHNAMGATRWINIPGVIRFPAVGIYEDHHAGDHRLVPVQPQLAASAQAYLHQPGDDHRALCVDSAAA